VNERKTCVICGKAFYSHIANQITCSPACSNERKKQTEADRRAKKPKERKEKVCPECGKIFVPESPQRMYCSKRCQDRHRKKAIYNRYEKKPVRAKKPKEKRPAVSLMDRWATAFKRGETNKTYGGWVADLYLAEQKQKEAQQVG
jgi:endogenous inhibitor of DNA gyrase (YacG/DUF329 family)